MNYRSLANKGRYGDSELRNVAGRRSHVNKREANLIDMLGIKGEALTQTLGSGTRNPQTGMPEYYSWDDFKKHAGKAVGTVVDSLSPTAQILNLYEDISGNETGINTVGELIEDPSKKMIDTGQIGENLGLDPEEDGNNWNLDFDPTSEQFKAMVLQTGDYSKLIEGYGFEAGDTQFFDKPNMEQLGFITDQFNIDEDRIAQNELGLGQDWASTQAEIGIGRDTLAENLRSATASVDIGRQSSGLQAGRNLAGSRQQGATAISQSNMATSGTIATQQKAASKGIWQDYNQQQKTLSNQMTSAQSAFDTGGRSLDVASTRGQQAYDRGMTSAGINRTAADLSKRRGESQFWEWIESDFYAMASNLE